VVAQRGAQALPAHRRALHPVVRQTEADVCATSDDTADTPAIPDSAVRVVHSSRNAGRLGNLLIWAGSQAVGYKPKEGAAGGASSSEQTRYKRPCCPCWPSTVSRIFLASAASTRSVCATLLRSSRSASMSITTCLSACSSIPLGWATNSNSVSQLVFFLRSPTESFSAWASECAAPHSSHKSRLKQGAC